MLFQIDTRWLHAPLLLAMFCRSASGQPQHLDPFPNATAGTFFSGVLSDGAVLQRAPRSARLFGVVIGATENTTVTVAVHGAGVSYEVDAEVEPTAMKVKAGGLYTRWKATLKPHEAGGNFTAAASCAKCGAAAGNTARLAGLQFGDVWFCSGQVDGTTCSLHAIRSRPPLLNCPCTGALQSNMELPMLHDHSRNNSFDAVMAGKYSHIRLMEMGKNKLRDGSSADGNDHVSLSCTRVLLLEATTDCLYTH
jgi:hypothetical protein